MSVTGFEPMTSPDGLNDFRSFARENSDLAKRENVAFQHGDFLNFRHRVVALSLRHFGTAKMDDSSRKRGSKLHCLIVPENQGGGPLDFS